MKLTDFTKHNYMTCWGLFGKICPRCRLDEKHKEWVDRYLTFFSRRLWVDFEDQGTLGTDITIVDIITPCSVLAKTCHYNDLFPKREVTKYRRPRMINGCFDSYKYQSDSDLYSVFEYIKDHIE